MILNSKQKQKNILVEIVKEKLELSYKAKKIQGTRFGTSQVKGIAVFLLLCC